MSESAAQTAAFIARAQPVYEQL
ncbi:MAG: hypothetical protein JWM05_615, partial [Acidimicrobiales bacterium]|nr:hypothetical protein [Acidimicrobiales bacterium]